MDVKNIRPEKLFNLKAAKHLFGLFLSNTKICITRLTI